MRQMKTIQFFFFERFHDHLRDFQCDDIIIGGDFNLVLDIDIDKKGGLAKTHTKAVKVIKDHIAELDLVDVWQTPMVADTLGVAKSPKSIAD